MTDWRKTLVSPDASILDAMSIIDASTMQVALVVDPGMQLLGIITDGDIRRGVLKGVKLDEPVSRILRQDYVAASAEDTNEAILASMKATGVRQVPVLDAGRVVIGLKLLADLLQFAPRENWVVLMAGGEGKRLRPLTNDRPKPMLEIGGKPVLQTILENFISQGFRRFYVSVNYKADMIEAHFGDGSRWGADIRYLRENHKLGTAGSLSLLTEQPVAPLIVMNGDVLTKVNFQHLLDFHLSHDAAATMCVREYHFECPFGVVRTDQHRLVRIDEKPVQLMFVNAGIYVLKPVALQFVRQGQFLDMPQLFEQLIENRRETVAFPLREYWLDIGHAEDFERAHFEYPEFFG